MSTAAMGDNKTDDGSDEDAREVKDGDDSARGPENSGGVGDDSALGNSLPSLSSGYSFAELFFDSGDCYAQCGSQPGSAHRGIA